MKTGKIRIKDDGVYFEPDGLFAKPSWNPTESDPFNSLSHLKWEKYKLELQDYEASKQLVEVRNWVVKSKSGKDCGLDINGNFGVIFVSSHQECEADVKDNRALITKIL